MVDERLEISPGPRAPNADLTATFDHPPSLRSSTDGPSGLFLDINYTFALARGDSARSRAVWRATTRMYEYRLPDHEHQELLVYHWQPGPSYHGPDHPHLHISAALHAQINAIAQLRIELDKLHLVTGMVSLEAVIRMLITEWKIAPLRHNWRDILARTEALSANDVHP